ncbi:DUF3140 domain-containing protein [Lewinella sp. IMCC34191]|uniref:DUF3140 domain-containing protein n=1 Tax=Lewinella sp. IMCC34191 TaxID=2259172 RepID=UPI000E267AB6|nr:DUF3140 domain-containing protein [Lewinella sp. IMCC34191]
MADKSEDQIYDEFYDAVNMAPKELEEWLDTEASKSVGDDKSGESTGHKSGKKIVKIKRKKKDDLTRGDYDHMQKVVSYVHRHLAQRPDGDAAGTDWAYSLKNWGHDPTK